MPAVISLARSTVVARPSAAAILPRHTPSAPRQAVARCTAWLLFCLLWLPLGTLATEPAIPPVAPPTADALATQRAAIERSSE